MAFFRDQLTDSLDYYTFGEHDKHMFSGHSGKQRSKREVALHSNRPDPSGSHSRKVTTKLRNTERNQRNNQRSKKLNKYNKKQRVIIF